MRMHDIKSLSHTKWKCKYHMVFGLKFRRKVFLAGKVNGNRENTGTAKRMADDKLKTGPESPSQDRFSGCSVGGPVNAGAPDRSGSSGPQAKGLLDTLSRSPAGLGSSPTSIFAGATGRAKIAGVGTPALLAVLCSTGRNSI